MSNNYQKPATTEPDNGGSDVERSKASAQGGVAASPAELMLALEALQKRNEELERQNIAKTETKSDLQKLTELLAAAIAPKSPVMAETDNINRTADFKNSKMTVDGRSLMEAQQNLQSFRGERKKPISVSKALQSAIGNALTITVNGVRVSIPADGKTYMINETHWEHAKERLAKIDRMMADTEPQIIEVG